MSHPPARIYRPRRAHFESEERIGDWRLKLYGLADPQKGVKKELLDATRTLAAQSLPPIDADNYGAAFAIAHDALYPIAIIYWWRSVNELHQRSYVGQPGDYSDLKPVTFTPVGCVHELGLVELERRAWIEDVIGNPKGPDLELYLSRRFEGSF